MINHRSITSSPKEFVCTLMKFENFRINCRKDVLKFEVILESFLVAVESRQGSANISICRE